MGIRCLGATLAGVAGILAAGAAAAEPPLVTDDALVLPFDGEALDKFGTAVGLDGDTLVAGAYLDDDGADAAGSAYVYVRGGTPGTWTFVTKLVSPTPQAADHLGRAVAVDGDTIAVGAPFDDEGGIDLGAVFVFERNLGGPDAWGLSRVVTASDGVALDSFGRTVWLSGDTLLVGATQHDAGASNAGAAYVFERNLGGSGNWGERTKLTASDPASNDLFGDALSLDGDTAVIGAWQDDDAGSSSGSAYVFERHAGGADAWGQVRKLGGDDAAAGDRFGASVAISGDVIVAGAYHEDETASNAGAAYVFERDEGGASSWGQTAKLLDSGGGDDDHFGWQVAVRGLTAVVGAPRRSVGPWIQAGAATAFTRHPLDGGWTEALRLAGDPQLAGGQASWVVALGDGAVALGALTVGSFPNVNPGGVYVFEAGLPTMLPARVPALAPAATLLAAGLLAIAARRRLPTRGARADTR